MGETSVYKSKKCKKKGPGPRGLKQKTRSEAHIKNAKLYEFNTIIVDLQLGRGVGISSMSFGGFAQSVRSRRISRSLKRICRLAAK